MSQRRIDLLSLLTFVAIGLPDGMLGTAWPAMHRTFHVPIGDLGVILLVQTVGSVLATGLVSGVVRRVGVGALLGGAAVIAGAAATGYSVAPALAMVLSVAILFGIASGSTDAGLNAVIGVSGRGRMLNLLHASYGVGTTIGPLVVTAALLLGSWRSAYLVLVAVQLMLAWQWFTHRRLHAADTSRHERHAAAAAALSPLPVAAVVAGIAVFFVYTGLEVAAGQWETVFDRNHLHMSATAAGISTFAYWGSLTAVRIALALIPRTPSNHSVVRAGVAISLAASAVIWLVPPVPVKVAGFVVLGGALAGIFPALVALTPGRVGADHAGRVISWEVGAASAGGAAVAAIIGLLVDAVGLSILGPALTILALALLLGATFLNRLETLRHRA